MLLSNWSCDLHRYVLLKFLNFADCVKLSRTHKALIPPRGTPWPHSNGQTPVQYSIDPHDFASMFIPHSGWFPKSLSIHETFEEIMIYLPPCVTTLHIHHMHYNMYRFVVNHLHQLEKITCWVLEQHWVHKENTGVQVMFEHINKIKPGLKFDVKGKVLVTNKALPMYPSSWVLECSRCGGNGHISAFCRACVVCKKVHENCPNCNKKHAYVCAGEGNVWCEGNVKCDQCYTHEAPTHEVLHGKKLCKGCSDKICHICWAFGHSTHQHRCPCGKHKKYEIRFLQKGKIKTLQDRVFWKANRTSNTKILECKLGVKIHGLRPHARIIECICPTAATG